MHLANLCPKGGGNRDKCTDAESVRAAILESNAEIVIRIAAVVAVVNEMVLIVVRQNDVDVAIAISVEASHTASQFHVGQPSGSGCLHKRAVTLRMEKANLIDRVVVQSSSFTTLPAVDVKNVEVAIVVEVGKTTAPAPTTIGNTRHVRYVFERAGTIVAVKPVTNIGFGRTFVEN